MNIWITIPSITLRNGNLAFGCFSFQIIYLASEPDDLIVLSPRWLCVDILGRLLSHNHIDRFPKSGHLTLDDIRCVFPKSDPIDLLSVFVSLDVCARRHAGDEIENIFPCFNAIESPASLWEKPADENENEDETSQEVVCGGVLVACPKSAGSQIKHVFARVQIALQLALAAQLVGSTARQWHRGTKIMREELSAVVGLSVGGQMLEIECRGPDARRSDLFQMQEDLCAIIFGIMSVCCPGLYLERRPVSAIHLRAENATPHVYAPRDILAAQLAGRSSIPLDEGTGVAETLADLLAFGSEEIYSRLKPGIDLHISYLSLYARCRLSALLDPTDPLGRDWCMLAVACGLADHLPSVDTKEAIMLSKTDTILAMWSNDATATIRALYKKLLELERPDVVDMLLELAPMFCPPPLISHGGSGGPRKMKRQISRVSQKS